MSSGIAPPKSPGKVEWLTPASPERSTVVEVGLTTEEPADVERLVAKSSHYTLLKAHRLPNGETLLVLLSEIEEALEDVVMDMHKGSRIVFSTADPNDTGWPLRGCIGKLANEGRGPLVLWELGGFKWTGPWIRPHATVSPEKRYLGRTDERGQPMLEKVIPESST